MRVPEAGPGYVLEGLREVGPGCLWLLEKYILGVGSLTEREKHEASMALGWLRRTMRGVDRNSCLHGRYGDALETFDSPTSGELRGPDDPHGSGSVGGES